MFELSQFIVTNTVNGVKNGTFSKEYANIMAVNYMLKGVLSEEDVISISTQVEEWEAQNALNGEVFNEGEEIIEEEETSPTEATEGITEDEEAEVVEESTEEESLAE